MVSDDMLSQDEIDALLKGEDDDSDSHQEDRKAEIDDIATEEYLSSLIP